MPKNVVSVELDGGRSSKYKLNEVTAQELKNILGNKDQIVEIPDIDMMPFKKYILHKVAWWFLKEEQDPPPPPFRALATGLESWAKPAKESIFTLRDYLQVKTITDKHVAVPPSPKNVKPIFKAPLLNVAGADDNIDDLFPIKPDKRLKQMQASLQINHSWNLDLQLKWDEANRREMKLKGKYGLKVKKFLQDPNLHPDYDKEWSEFCYSQSEKYENEGKDIDFIDFNSQWLKLWSKILQSKLEIEYLQEISKARQSLGMDYGTLKSLVDISMAKNPVKSDSSSDGKYYYY